MSAAEKPSSNYQFIMGYQVFQSLASQKRKQNVAVDLTFQMFSKQQTQNPGTKAPAEAKESPGWTKKVKA